jgi:hypothetical protein
MLFYQSTSFGDNMNGTFTMPRQMVWLGVACAVLSIFALLLETYWGVTILFLVDAQLCFAFAGRPIGRNGEPNLSWDIGLKR